MKQRYLSTLICLSLSATVVAQDFNLDFNSNLIPADSYGAVRSAGYWNYIHTETLTPLRDLNDNPTGALAAINYITFPNDFSCFGSPMLDGLSVVGAGTITFVNLEPGSYEAIVYAMNDDAQIGVASQVTSTPVQAYQQMQITGQCAGTEPTIGTVAALVRFDRPTGGGINLYVHAKDAQGHSLLSDPFMICGVQLRKISVQNIGQPVHCNATPNSTGGTSLISARATSVDGSAHLIDNDLYLAANNIPAGEPAQFLYGVRNAAPVPLMGGNLCINTPLKVGPAVMTNASGVADVAVDAPAFGFISGSTICFQCYYRDPGSTPNANLSTAIEVTFLQ